MNRVMTARTCTGLVLKGTPGATYTFEIGIDDSWVENLLHQGNDAVDPTGYADYTYLQLDGTEFKKFTEVTNLEGQAYLMVGNVAYEGATTPITMFFSDEDIMTSGVVNDNCYWSYDADTKTLTLSGDETGTGSFAKEYDPANYAKSAPWRTWTTAEGVVVRKGVEDGIEHIVVENGVNYIGDYAFYGLKNLEDVTLASTVNLLGEGTMQNNPKLTSVILLCPSFVYNYYYAFDDSDLLTIYAIKGYASQYANNFKYDYPNITVKDFLLTVDFDEVTQTGDYRYKVQARYVFADEANDNVISDPFTVTNSPTSGEGWAFDIDKRSLTISGNVTGEPWLPFANNINNVFVDQNVTQMPANAFTDRNAYNSLRRVILRSTAVVDLNGAFSNKYEVWNEEAQDYVEKYYLGYDIYVPSSIVESYRTTYASQRA